MEPRPGGGPACQAWSNPRLKLLVMRFLSCDVHTQPWVEMQWMRSITPVVRPHATTPMKHRADCSEAIGLVRRQLLSAVFHLPQPAPCLLWPLVTVRARQGHMLR